MPATYRRLADRYGLLLPATQEVHIVVPPEAVEKANDLAHFQQGGTAGLLNYSAYRSYFSSYGNHSSNSYLNLESGFNAGDWMVRGAHNLRQSSAGGFTFDNAYVYAQKTLVDRKQLLQAGQINFSNNLLSGASIDGMQLIPQSALSSQGEGHRCAVLPGQTSQGWRSVKAGS